MATAARLGVAHAGLVAERHCSGARRQPRRGVPVAAARAEGGEEALRNRPRPGGPAKLTAEQRAQIPALLARGAEAYGFRGDVWTANRIAEVIWRTFGVRYHRDHVSRLSRQIGWSHQQPIERATQRNEQVVEQWYAQRWPKKPPMMAPPSSG
jgi:transposase